MNWTHRITLLSWGGRFLIDVTNPEVCAKEGSPDKIIPLFDGWLERVKESPNVKIEELNFSLENE